MTSSVTTPLSINASQNVYSDPVTNIFYEMKTEILAEFPKAQSLGIFWRFKIIGASKTENTRTRYVSNIQTTQGFHAPDKFKQHFVTVWIKKKQYFLKWGTLQQ